MDKQTRNLIQINNFLAYIVMVKKCIIGRDTHGGREKELFEI
jgi:hypothetical protein